MVITGFLNISTVSLDIKINPNSWKEWGGAVFDVENRVSANIVGIVSEVTNHLKKSVYQDQLTIHKYLEHEASTSSRMSWG